MRPRRNRAPAPLDAVIVFNVDEAFERRVDLLAGLVIHLTSLADRYDEGIVNGLPAAAATRVARLRNVSESSRDTLVGLALWDQPDIAQAPGEPGDAGLRTALATRTLIGQAQGVLMHRCQVGTGEALEMLRAAARDRAITLGQLAREVVSTPLKPRPEGDGTDPALGGDDRRHERPA